MALVVYPTEDAEVYPEDAPEPNISLYPEPDET